MPTIRVESCFTGRPSTTWQLSWKDNRGRVMVEWQTGPEGAKWTNKISSYVKDRLSQLYKLKRESIRFYHV